MMPYFTMTQNNGRMDATGGTPLKSADSVPFSTQNDVATKKSNVPVALSSRADDIVKQLQARLVVVWCAVLSFCLATKSNLLMFYTNPRPVFASKKFQVSALSAAAGATVVGAGGALFGMAV